MPQYDLDTTIINVGFARVGKSTLTLQQSKLILMFQLMRNDIDADMLEFVYNRIIYDRSQSRAVLKNYAGLPMAFDEAYMTYDARTSMDQEQIELIRDMNFLASKRNIIFVNIQQFADLDKRILAKANVLQLLYEQGNALLFIKSNNFPVVKSTWDFTWFQKHERVLDNMDIALDYLVRVRGYNGIIKWKDIPKEDIVLNAYLKVKQKRQNI